MADVCVWLIARSGVDPIAGCGQERCRPDSGVWLGARCFIPLGQLCFQAGGIHSHTVDLERLHLSLAYHLPFDAHCACATGLLSFPRARFAPVC